MDRQDHGFGATAPPESPEVASLHDEGEQHEEHIHLPPESLWPITAASGIAMAASVFVLNWYFFIPAVIVFFFAMRGWMKEILHDSPD